MDYDKRHKRRSGGLGSEPADLGDPFVGDRASPTAEGPDALDAPVSSTAGAEGDGKNYQTSLEAGRLVVHVGFKQMTRHPRPRKCAPPSSL